MRNARVRWPEIRTNNASQGIVSEPRRVLEKIKNDLSDLSLIAVLLVELQPMHVLVLSIGPVQEFIESARKCRDLWFGSWLLSELARAAARGLVEAEGGAEPEVLVFPGASTKNGKQAVANKIVARVRQDPALVAQKSEDAMRRRLTQIREIAFRRVAPKREDREKFFLESIAIEQVDQLIEFLWASAPENKPDSYPVALQDAERLLAAVKNSKKWGQPSWAKDGIPKSSLDGIRESVLHESLFNNPKNDSAHRNMSDGRLRREFGVHGAERLCGVGLLKRFGSVGQEDKGRPERIFSTSHVASGPFRAGLARLPALHASWSRLLDELGRVHGALVDQLDVVPREDPTTGYVDGSIFYEGRLVETLEELGFDEKKERESFDTTRQALRSFLRKTSPGLGEPTPYYALLLADGDRMGKVIAEQTSFKEHRALSDTLEEFASSTRQFVEKHEGALIYSGGDDVLALLPLHTLLACARGLAAQFEQKMRRWTVDEGGQRKSPTLSVGVAVVHHLLPLDEALALVRKTEKDAKHVEGKNALAITVKKRGGEAVSVQGTWGKLDVRLEDLIELHRDDAISTKAQYELMDLAARLEDAGNHKAALEKVQAAEATRILARKQPRKGKETLAEETRARLAEHDAFTDPARLGRELYVAHLLARALDQANPPQETGALLEAQS